MSGARTHQHGQLDAHPDTRLHGRRLLAARALWLAVTALSVLLFSAGLVARLAELLSLCEGAACAVAQLTPAEAAALQSVGLSLAMHAALFMMLESAFIVVYALVGLLIFSFRSDDRFGIFVSLTLITFGAIIPPPVRTLAQTAPAVESLVHLLQVIGWGMFFTFLYLFPNGRFVPRWTRVWPALVLGGGVLWLLLPNANIFNWPLPLAVAAFLVWFTSGLLTQLYRYRRVSTPTQRQQTKWVVFGFAGALAGMALFGAPLLIVPALSQPGFTRAVYYLLGIPVFAFALFLIPITIGISILRFRLWEIDILIRRTLVYSTLTLSLLVFYFANVVVWQLVLRLLTGQQQSDLVTIVSTLVIAALFAPLRGVLQRWIDRAFYRRKYDAARTLAAFSASLRDEVDLQQLHARLLSVVDDTMQPAHVSLWLRSSADDAARRRERA